MRCVLLWQNRRALQRFSERYEKVIDGFRACEGCRFAVLLRPFDGDDTTCLACFAFSSKAAFSAAAHTTAVASAKRGVFTSERPGPWLKCAPVVGSWVLPLEGAVHALASRSSL